MRRLTVIDQGSAAFGRLQEGGSMRVAIATQDMKLADAHFASARTLALYDVSKEGHRLVGAVQFEQCSAEDGVHDNESDRVGVRLGAIEGCALLFVTGIGGPAAARVVNQRVHPVKLPAPEPIPALLDLCRGARPTDDATP